MHHQLSVQIWMKRSREIDIQESLTLSDLTRMAEGKQNWRLEIEGSYHAVALYEVWESEETDAELNTRIKKEKLQAERKASREAAQLAKQRVAYELLKQQFET
jgi:hypothetical protein